MSRTVTALYDTTAEAEAARQRLSSAVDVEHVKVIDQQSQASGKGGGLGDYHFSHEDRHAYNEGLRRGGALLCAEVDGDEDTDKIVSALEQTGGVDLEERQQSWRNEGWSPFSGSEGSGRETGSASSERQSAFGGSTSSAENRAVEEERIPIVNEELRVGKREVERGGARVRTYVREVPVREEVTLREEHVSVERRPVDQQGGTAAQTGAADMLRERTVEMVEKAEEAVVQKVASVSEEVVVTKTASERTEQIEDTVRRTEVDVEENPQTGSSTGEASGERSAFGGFGSGSGNNDGGARP
jgi:uncharacterized protein (TIGR02271 family)